MCVQAPGALNLSLRCDSWGRRYYHASTGFLSMMGWPLENVQQSGKQSFRIECRCGDWRREQCILTLVNQNPKDKSCRTTGLNSANAPNGGCFNHMKMHIHEHCQQTTGREQNVSDTLNSDAGEGF